MPLPASTPTWKLIRWVVKHSVEVVPPAVLYLMSLLDDDADVDDIEWRRFHIIGNRTVPSGLVEDKAQFKLDIVNITGSALDTTWTSGDFTAVDTAITTFMTTLQSQMSTDWTWSSLAAYRMAFNPTDPGPGTGPETTSRPFQLTGPPVYLASKSLSGSGTDRHPYQVATTCTLKTGWPKHWGRIYLPCPSFVPANGSRNTSAHRTALANAMFDLMDDLGSAGFLITVPVGQAAKQRFHALLGVSQIVVDDIPDVIRRRRPKQAAFRVVGVE